MVVNSRHKKTEKERKGQNGYDHSGQILFIQKACAFYITSTFPFLPLQQPDYRGSQEKQLKEHIGIKTDLVINNKIGNDIKDTGCPCVDILPGCQPYGYQPQQCAEKFDITHPVTVKPDECVANIQK